MTDLGDSFREMRKAGQDKREKNRFNSAKILKNNGIPFESKNYGAHLIVEGPECFIDFWPGTGRWKIRLSGKTGFGVINLLKYIKPETEYQLRDRKTGSDRLVSNP